MRLKLKTWFPASRFAVLTVLCSDGSTNCSAEIRWNKSGKFSKAIGDPIVAFPQSGRDVAISEIREYTQDTLDFLDNVEKVGKMVEKRLQKIFNE